MTPESFPASLSFSKGPGRLSSVARIFSGFLSFVFILLLALGSCPIQARAGVITRCFGGAGADTVAAAALDPEGNLVVAGTIGSPAGSFPVSPGAFQTAPGGGLDMFVAKLNPRTGAILFATYLGGSGNDSATGLALDGKGGILVCGFTDSNDFPLRAPFPGGDALHGMTDAILVKMEDNGATLKHSACLGGAGDDRATGIAFSAPFTVYLSGITSLASAGSFPVTGNCAQMVYGGGDEDGFVARIHLEGLSPASLEACGFLGGDGTDQALSLDANETFIMVAGKTGSGNFPVAAPLAGSACHGAPGSFDAFAARLSPDLALLEFSTCFGGDPGLGTLDQSANCARIDSAGAAYLTGITTAPDFPVTNAAFPAYSGNGDAFFMKLDTVRKSVVFSTYLGGNGRDEGLGLWVGADGRAGVAGATRSPDFPVREDPGPGFSGTEDAFVTEFDAGGGPSGLSAVLGGEAGSLSSAMVCDVEPSSGLLVVSGSTTAAVFHGETDPGARQGGDEDAFVSVITEDATPVSAAAAAPGEESSGGGGCFLRILRGLSASVFHP